MDVNKKRLVIACTVKNLSKIKKVFHSQGQIPWLYLGKDFLKRRLITERLGKQFSKIDTAKLLDGVATDIRQAHVRWIDKLNRRYGDNIDWWFGSISSRDICINNLFQYHCYLELLKRLWERDELPELVIVESPALSIAICKWAKNQDIDVCVENVTIQRFWLWGRYIALPFRFGYYALDFFLRLIAAFLSRASIKPDSSSKHCDIIVDTFVHNDSLSEDGLFIDRYFPYLHPYLSNQGKRVMIHPVLCGMKFNYLTLYRKLRRSKSCFIIPEDYLRFSDYCKSLTFPVRYLRTRVVSPVLDKFDMNDILKEEKRLQALAGIRAVIVYRLFMRLGQAGLRPAVVLNWYENQIIDKALIAGVRQYLPGARIIGAQMFQHSQNFLNWYPSQSEVEKKLVPDILLETSQHQCDIVQAFTDDIPCSVAAALRYQHIFEDNSINSISCDNNQIILVLLPFDIAESVEMLEIFNDALDDIRDDTTVLIKNHPDYSPEKLIRSYGQKHWPKRFNFISGVMSEALRNASLVISSNSSSMVEAAAKGIPVISLGRQAVLNQNVLSGLGMELVTECFSAEELAVAVNKYLGLSHIQRKEYREMGKNVRDLFFTPVNEKTMLPFLGIHGEGSVSQ